MALKIDVAYYVWDWSSLNNFFLNSGAWKSFSELWFHFGATLSLQLDRLICPITESGDDSTTEEHSPQSAHDLNERDPSVRNQELQ